MTRSDLNTRRVAQDARAFALAQGATVGGRGRLSKDAFTAFLMAHPQKAREIAKAAGIEISKRGRLARTDAERVAALVR